MNDSYMEIPNNDETTLYRIKFFTLLILQIPSVILYLLIFLYVITHRLFIKTPESQGVLVLLLVNFLEASCDLPMVIHFYYFHRVTPATSAYCTWWTFFEYTLSAASEFLMAIISVQRHMFIFNNHKLRVRKKRLLFHHLPLLVCVVYPTLLYLGLVVIYPCDGTLWNFSSNLCGSTNCYLMYHKILAIADWVMDSGLPVVIIIVANAWLIARVVWQKRRRQQPVSWQKQRRLVLQLLSISCVYIIAWLPNTIIAVIQQFNESNSIAQIQSKYVLNLLYLVCILIPWVYVGMLPGFKKWVLKRLSDLFVVRNAVAPTVMARIVARQ